MKLIGCPRMLYFSYWGKNSSGRWPKESAYGLSIMEEPDHHSDLATDVSYGLLRRSEVIDLT